MLGRKALIITSLVLVLVSASTASVFSTGSQADWNQGTFNGTSPDRDNNSGNLGIGYLNGSNSGQPQKTGLNNGSLLGYWRMDQVVSGTDGKVHDFSGRENNGSTKGSLTTGANGIMSTNTFEFDGSNDYVDLPDTINSDLSGSITFSAWIKPQTTDGTMVIGMLEPGNFEAYKLFRLRTSFDNWKILDSTGTAHGVNFNNQPPVDQWSHIVGVYDDAAGEMILYLNGSEDAVANTGSFSYDQLDKPANIGRDPRDSSYITGNIDEVRIYNRSLSQQEVESLYFEGVNGKFGGNYTAEKVDNSQETSWNNLEVNASVPSDTQLTAKFKALDTDGNVVDSEYIDIVDHPDPKNYSVNVQNSEDAEVVFNGTSTNASKTWEINEFKTYYSEANPPNINIDDPANSTISDSTPWLNVTADEAIDTWKYNVDTGSNNTFTPNTTLSSLSDGQHNVTVWANDSAGNFNSSTRYFSISTGGGGGSNGSVTTRHGYFQTPASGGNNVNVTSVGFKPDLVEFKITTTIENYNTTTYYGGRNFGWGFGFANCQQDPCNEVAVSDGSGSSSTNGYVAASADNYSIYQAVSDNDGDSFNGYISGTVTNAHSSGFNLDFDRVQEQQYVAYTAYNFSSDTDVSVGNFSTKKSEGMQSVTTGNDPNFLHIATSPEIKNMSYFESTGNGGDEHGWSLGYAAQREGESVEQRAMSTTLYSNNIDTHVWASNDSEIMHTLWKEDSGPINGWLQAKLDSFDSNGFTLDYRNVTNEPASNSYAAIYWAVNSTAAPDVGHGTTPTSTQTELVNTDVGLESVSLAASNTIEGIDTEGFSGNNNGDNHWGFMFGGGNSTDQRAMGFSSHSNSLYAHGTKSSNLSAFQLLYTDRNGNFDGNETASITNINDTGFELDWTEVTSSSSSNVRIDNALYIYYGFNESSGTSGSSDSSAPSTSDNYTASGWQSKSQKTVKLTASDSESSVDSISYRLNGGSWTTDSGSSTTLTISSNGNNTLEYNATDSNGNTESVNTEYVALDDETPSTSDNYTASGWQSKSQTTLKLTCSDSYSGCGDTSYRVDGGLWTTEAPPVTLTVSGDGNHTVEYNSTDTAGSTESTQTEYVALDSSSPTVSYNPTTTGSGTIGQDWIFINISASDSDSGLNSATEEFDGSNSSFANSGNGWYWENHTSLSDNSYTIRGWADDNAGNTAATSERDITVSTCTSNTASIFSVKTHCDWEQGTFYNTTVDGETLQKSILNIIDDFNDNNLAPEWYTADTDQKTGTSFDETNREIRIQANGADIWTNDDEYGAVYRDNVSGNWTTTVQLIYQEDNDNWAKAGIAVKNNMSSSGNSTGYSVVAATPGNGVTMQWDSDSDGYVDSNTQACATYTEPVKLRMIKKGNQLTGKCSMDGGSTWKTIDTVSPSGMRNVQDVGLIHSSHSSSTLSNSTFDNWNLTKTSYYTEANYTSEKIDNSQQRSWDKLEVDASKIPANTDLDAVVRSIDTDGNQIDQQVIDLQETLKNYSLNVQNSEDAETVFNSTGTNDTEEWEIDKFKVRSSSTGGGTASPDVTLESPADAATKDNPVFFNFTPRCYSNGGCSNASLYLNASTSGSTNLFKTSTQTDWNQGIFNGSSPDREDNSGEIGIGYLNGTKSGQSNDNGLNNGSLIGYWRLDRDVSGSGGKAFDYSGKGYNGEYVNSVNTGSGGVFSTNGTDLTSGDDSVEADHYIGLKGNSKFALSIWYKGVDPGGALVSVNYNDNPHQGIDIWDGGGGEICQHIIKSWTGDALKQCVDSGGTDYIDPLDGDWHHIVTTYDGSKSASGIDLYVDGVKQPEITNSDTLTSNDVSYDSNPVRIGGRSDSSGNPSQTSAGKYDEFRIYNRSLSQPEIRKLYFNTSADKYFGGNYTSSNVDTSSTQSWDKLYVDSSVPTDTNASAVFKALDTNENVQEKQIINLSTEAVNHSLSVSDSEDAEVVFNGTSTNATKTWEVNEFKTYYSEAGGTGSGWEGFNTTTNVVNNTENSILFNFSENFTLPTTKKWNIKVGQSNGNISFAANNRTVTVGTASTDYTEGVGNQLAHSSSMHQTGGLTGAAFQKPSFSTGLKDTGSRTVGFVQSVAGATDATGIWDVISTASQITQLNQLNFNSVFKPDASRSTDMQLTDFQSSNTSFLTSAVTQTSTSTKSSSKTIFTDLAAETVSLTLTSSGEKDLIKVFAQQVLNYQNTATAGADYNTTKIQSISASSSVMGMFTGLESLTQALGFTAENNEKFKPNDSVEENIQSGTSTAENIKVNEAETQKITLRDESVSTVSFSELAEQAVSLTSLTSADKGLIEVFAQQLVNVNTQSSSNVSLRTSETQGIQSSSSLSAEFDVATFLEQQLGISSIQNEVFDANEELSENVQVNGSAGDNISAVESQRQSSQVGTQPEENISIVDRITGGFTASNSVTEIFKPRESTQVAVSAIEETRISPTFRSLVENSVETTMSAGLTWAANPTVSQSISYSGGTSVANNIYEVFLEDVLSVNTETGQTAGYNTSVNNGISSSQTVVETFKPVEIVINSVIATDAYKAVFKPEANLEQKIESGDAQNINVSFIDPANITVNSETTKNPVFEPVQNLGQSILVEDQKAGTFVVSQVLEQGLDYSLSSDSDITFMSEIGQSINSNAFSGSTTFFDSYLNSAIVVSETELANYSVKQGRKQNLDLITSKDSGFDVFELSENDLVVNTGTSSNISFSETLYESFNSPAVVDVTSVYSLSRANTVSVQTAAVETSERIFEALLSQSMVIQTAQNPNISYKSDQKQQITVSKSVEGVFARLIQLGQNYNVEERERSAFKPFSGINQFTSVEVAPDLNASYLTGTGQELILTNTQSSELAALDHLAQVVGQETRTNGDQIVLESAAQDIVTDTDDSASTLFSSTAFQTLDHQANPFSIQDLLAITTQPVVAQDGFDAGLLARSNPKQQVDVGKSVQSIFNPSETAQQQSNLITETETNLTFIQELSETKTYSKQVKSTATFLSMATSNIEIQNTFSQTSARIFEAFLEQTVDFQSSTRSQVEFNSSQNQGVNVGNTPTGAFTKMKSLTQGIDVGNELDPGFKPISNLDQSLALSTSSEQNASFVERNVAAIAAKSTQAPTLIATDLLYQNLQTNEDVEANIGITQTFDQGLEIGSNKKSTTTFADLAVQTTEFTSSTSTVQKLVVSAAQSLSNEETLSSETAALTAINQLIGTETGSETDFKPSVGIKDQITVDDITQNNLSFSEKVTGAVTYSNQIRSSANYLTTATSSTGAQTFASSTTQRILEAFVKQAVGINMDTNPDTDIKASSQSGIPVSNSITGFFAKNKIITQGINIEKNVNEIFKPLESTSQGISSENFVSQNISILEVASESVGVKSSSDSIFRLNIFAKQAVQTQTNPVPNTVFDLAADQVLGHGASTSESTSLMEALSELTGYQNLLSINAGFENRATQNISVSTSENADYSVLNTITQNTQLDNTIQNIFNPKANLNQTSRFETRQNTNIATLTAVSNSVSNTDMISSAAVFSTSSTSSFSFQNYAAYSSARIFEASLSQVIDAQDQSSSQASYRKLIENGLQITENINSVFETGFKLDQQTGFEQSIQEVFKPESKQEQQIEADNNMGQNASFLDVYTTNISVTTTQNSDLSLIRSIGENMGIITEESTGFNVSESSDQAVTAASTRTATPAWAAEAVQTLNLVAQSSNTIDLSLAVSQNVSAPTESDNLIDFAAANFQTVAIQTTDSTKLIWSIVRSQQIGLQKDALSMFNASEEVQQNLGTENSAQGILEGFDAVNQELKFEESPQGMFSAYTIQNNTLNVSSDQESSVSFNDLAIETISYSSRFYGFPGELFYVGVTQPIGIIDEGSENRQQEDSGSDEDAGSGGGSSGGSSGGGSGGGGGLSGDLFEDEPQGINVTPDNFTLRLDPDNTKERQVQVQNIGNEEIQVDGRVTSARRLISIPQYQKEIGPKETESFNVLIEPSDNVGPGVYDGSIDFESPYNTKNVEATIIVKNESADELLDVKLDMDSSEIISGESGAYKVDILNMGQSEKVDITLGKTVINTSSGERIYETTETLAVQTSASISRNIRKDTLTPGEYKLEIVAKYSNGNKTASTSTTFNVKENEQKSIWQSLPIAEYTVAALLVILATTALIYARKLYIKKKVEREVKEIKTEIKSQIEEGKIEDKHRIMLVLKQAEKSLDYSEYKHAYGKLEQIEEILE